VDLSFLAPSFASDSCTSILLRPKALSMGSTMNLECSSALAGPLMQAAPRLLPIVRAASSPAISPGIIAEGDYALTLAEDGTALEGTCRSA
jgi:hypothetical protein